MNGIEVDANRCMREWRAHMKKHDKYCDELIAINKAENEFIESLPGDIKHDQFDYYKEHYPEKYAGYEQARKDLEKSMVIIQAYILVLITLL